MNPIKFGAFLAPHHPIGENPILQYRRDLDLVEQLDQLGFDEFWCGEHHSTGWEVIPSPEMFLAAAGERTHRINLGTGVVSLPYHNPYHVAQRIVQLDHMTNGRAILGTGPGALASDAHMLGIDPMLLRDRQDEAIAVIRRLLAGERLTYECDWFNLYDAKLQLLPVRGEIPQTVASMVSPSGMTLAGKYGIGILSIGSMSTAGLAALPLQWSFAEESAAKHGQVMDRSNWRVLMNWHIAETKEQARAEALQGLHRWHSEYTVGTLQRVGVEAWDTPEETLDQLTAAGGVLIGTPDDLIAAIRDMYELAGGFGTVVGFVNDFAHPEAITRSWDMVARYVLPEVNGMLNDFRESNTFVRENREYFERAGQAILAKINENERAAAALHEVPTGASAISSHSNHDRVISDLDVGVRDIAFASAVDQAAAVAGGEISAIELLEATVARYERLNPAINAVVTTQLDVARERAAAADAATAAGESWGPSARRPHDDQGGMGLGWFTLHQRSCGTGWLATRPQRRGGRAAARCRRSHLWQDQPAGIHGRLADIQSGVWHHIKSVEYRSHSRWVIRRCSCSTCCWAHGSRAGQ